MGMSMPEIALAGESRRSRIPRADVCQPLLCERMSKKTKKRKARMRRSKANHGKRPNMGRR